MFRDYIAPKTLEHKKYLEKVWIYNAKIIITRIGILLALFALWEIAANLRWIDPFITSQPSRVFRTIMSMYNDGSLFYHTGITLLETIVGFLLGTIIGTSIAIILWWSDFLSKVLEPYLVVFNSLPKVALGPIIIVWVGLGPAAIITMALAISVIVTIMGVYSGFKEVDKDKITLVKSFGASKFQILQKVVLPASFPTIVSALKINVGLSWVGVIVGEFLVSKAGLGYLIIYGGQVFRFDLVMASVLILAVAAAMMYQLVAYFEGYVISQRNN